MKGETLLNHAMTTFKQKFLEICPEGPLPDLSVDSFAHLVQIFKESFSACGTAALKAYLEACDETGDVLACSFGKVRFKMKSDKEFLTPFGWVAVRRRLYQTDAGDISLVPLDKKWDMHDETLTPVVREAVHFVSGHNTPQVVEELLSKCALFNPSRTAMLHANEGFGTVWKRHGEAILAKVREKDEFSDFKAALEAEVTTTFSKLSARCCTMVIVDGSRALWNPVNANPHYNRCMKVVDFWHATEYLAKAAEAAYGEETYDGQGWLRKWKEALLKEKGGAARAIRAMEYLLKSRGLRGKRRTDLLSARRFFRNTLKRMNCAYFQSRNLPVGSGVVEAACKSVVKARMCQSGMRWTREVGQTILSLRTVIKSNRWDACWAEYQAIRMAA